MENIGNNLIFKCKIRKMGFLYAPKHKHMTAPREVETMDPPHHEEERTHHRLSQQPPLPRRNQRAPPQGETGARGARQQVHAPPH